MFIGSEFACIMKLASLLNHISVGGRVCRGRIWSPNIWGPSLSGAEFVRGRDVPESAVVTVPFLTASLLG